MRFGTDNCEQFIGTSLDNIRIAVTFADSPQTVITTSRKTSSYDFISGVGGNLGLFLGLSLSSILLSIYDRLRGCYKSQLYQ